MRRNEVTLRGIRLELARSAEFPEGSAEHGYDFVAPLDPEGRIDLEGWRANRERCVVRRFWAGEEDEHGHLVHGPGNRWVFRYDLDADPAEDESGFRFDSHRFRQGEYVSITEHDGVTRTFKVAAVD